MSQHTAYTITCCLLAGWLSVASLWGQSGPKEKPQKIEIKQAGSLRYDDSKGIKAQRLVDDVIFKTQNALMYCDSAYLYSDANRLEAFGNVRITEGDSIELRGDTMYYDGNTDLSQVRGNITLEDNNTLLTTRYLDYNGQTDMVYYLGGGRIVNKSSTDTLTSTYGYYFPKQKTYYFKDSVVMRTPAYTIHCDTMQYNTLTEITRFFGPTNITGDSSNIYCERGWYDPKNDRAMFKQHAYIQRNAQELAGDSVFYNRATGIGEAFGNVAIRDTVENFIVKGDWGINYEKDSLSIVTGHAELIQVFARDSLFLHADTLYSSFDSTRQHRIIQAYHGVRFFKPDLQGKCDSLVFSNADTTIRMYVDPVIWSDANQLTADTIILRNRDGELDRMWMDHNAF
ncbi:MAG: OstA-like protein, partial [Bacteroidota bacterium]